MADSSLDDFFAKKDKSKKGKAKTKYTTSDTIAKKLEDGGKKPEPTPKKDVKEKVPLISTVPSISIPTTTNEQEDDEWKHIEEAERDYSGLKIQALSISEKEKEEEQLKEQLLSEQNGDASKSGEGQSGPWRKCQGTTAPPVEKEVEEEKPPETVEAPEKEEAVAKPAAKYVPPSMRAGATPSSGGSSSRRNPKNAPQLSSDFDFPSLSSATEGGKGKYSEADKTFQSVKHGARSKGDSQKEVQLDLENKFSALHQGD